MCHEVFELLSFILIEERFEKDSFFVNVWWKNVSMFKFATKFRLLDYLLKSRIDLSTMQTNIAEEYNSQVESWRKCTIYIKNSHENVLEN